MQIFDRRASLLCFHIFGNQLHRARPIERDQRDNVVEFFDLELFRQIGHPARLHLEQTDRFAPVVEIECRLVVERNTS